MQADLAPLAILVGIGIWAAFSFVVGVGAVRNFRRDRIGWTVLALVVSPLIAMLMLFVLGPLTDAEVQKRDEALEREKAWLARARAAEAERHRKDEGAGGQVHADIGGALSEPEPKNHAPVPSGCEPEPGLEAEPRPEPEPEPRRHAPVLHRPSGGW